MKSNLAATRPPTSRGAADGVQVGRSTELELLGQQIRSNPWRFRNHLRSFTLKVDHGELRRLKTITTSLGHVPELDGIRGFACISVLLAHCLIGMLTPAVGPLLEQVKGHTVILLFAGVDLFFVLSGFLIGGILMDTRGQPHFFKRFWIRRVARIFPVLWVLLASYAGALVLRANFNFPQMDLWLLQEPKPPFWTYATFTQSLPMAQGGNIGPRWVGITWSLAVEEQFYLCFPVAVYFLSRRSLGLTAFACIVVAPFFRDLFAHHFNNWYAPYVLLPSRIDGLMFGVMVAIVVRNYRALVVARQIRWILLRFFLFM